MNTSDILNYKFKFNHFATYGLNKLRNLLQAPVCDDCGGTGRLVFEEPDEVFEMCASLLDDMGFDNTAIFLVTKDGEYHAVIYYYSEDDKPEAAQIRGEGLDFFAEVDANLVLDGYGLLLQHDDGSWEICE